MIDSPFKIRQLLESNSTLQDGGIYAIFERMGIASYTRLNIPEDYQQDRPRIEIKVTVGAATGRRHVCPDGVLRFDAFEFDLEIQCVTEPSNSATENGLHEDFCARIRNVASSLGGPSNFIDVANFPTVYIAEPVKNEPDSETLTDEGLEFTTLSFSGIVCIRHDAWPAN